MKGVFLETIVAHKRREVEALRQRIPLQEWQAKARDAEPPRDFAAAIHRPNRVSLIAEVKKASPSKGMLREDFDPVALAHLYAHHGASAISVLTDERFFQGRPEHLTAVKGAVPLPVLCKEFILEDYQVWQSRALGADAVLLIAALLPPKELRRLRELAESLGMASLVEVHTEAEIEMALEAGARILGVNNRNLHTFETSLETTLRLREHVPRDRPLVSESGIFTREDVERLAAVDISAVLVGEALVTSPDIGKKVRELAGVPRPCVCG